MLPGGKRPEAEAGVGRVTFLLVDELVLGCGPEDDFALLTLGHSVAPGEGLAAVAVDVADRRHRVTEEIPRLRTLGLVNHFVVVDLIFGVEGQLPEPDDAAPLVPQRRSAHHIVAASRDHRSRGSAAVADSAVVLAGLAAGEVSVPRA